MPPAKVPPGKILRLELKNFKSYMRFQSTGPFEDFTAIIGPNNKKSDLSDAIFVLGGQLRGAQFKDLIYAFDDRDKEQRGHIAFMRMVYRLNIGAEFEFYRTITNADGSEYRVNGKSVNLNECDRRLMDLGILVKGEIFWFSSELGLQEDVESIASNNPKELTGLLEQISGYEEFKRKYEELEEEKGKAEESSALPYKKKKTI